MRRVINWIRRGFSPSTRLFARGSYRRVLVVCVALPFGLAWALSRFLAPVASEQAIKQLRTLKDVRTADTATLEWTETIRRMSAARPRNALEQLLPELPLLRSNIDGEVGDSITRLASTWSNASPDELTRQRTILLRFERRYPSSIPLHYALAAIEWRRGNGSEARARLENLIAEIGDSAKPGATNEGEIHSARLVLLHHLAGRSALSYGRTDAAIASLRDSIRSTNAMAAVTNSSNPRNYRVTQLFRDDAAAALARPADAAEFTNLSLYDGLLVAYWRAKAFPGGDRDNEFRRRPRDISDTLLTQLLRASVPWAGEPWGTVKAEGFKLPEQLVWTISNLQRLRHANGPDLGIRHLLLEAAVLRELADSQASALTAMGIPKEQVAQGAVDALNEAWERLPATQTDRLQRELVLLPLWSDVLLPQGSVFFADRPLSLLGRIHEASQDLQALNVLRLASSIRSGSASPTIDLLEKTDEVLLFGNDTVKGGKFSVTDLAWLRQWRAAVTNDLARASLAKAIEARTRSGATGNTEAAEWLATMDWLARRDRLSRSRLFTERPDEWPNTEWRLYLWACTHDNWQAVVAAAFVMAAVLSRLVWLLYLATQRHKVLVRSRTLNVAAFKSRIGLT